VLLYNQSKGEEKPTGNHKKRRLNPLDNVKEPISQYVSGIAERSSLRISLDYRGR
jgi:hypothetical protein